MTDDASSKRTWHFDLDATDRRARVGRAQVAHGSIETPAFLPVASHGAIKGLTPRELRETGTQIALASSFHLSNSPGEDTVQKMGGLHRMMGWHGPLATGSGAFQAFNLPTADVDESGISFERPDSGETVHVTPEKSIEIQEKLGADIVMAFDRCVEHPCEHEVAEAAVDRTARWLQRCADAKTRDDQALFGIVQGSVYPDLRTRSTERTLEVDLPGYAIGGLSVGQDHKTMMEMLEHTVEQLPEDKPRYLMAVGYPEDLVEGVARGVDLFDCTIPTRHARSGIVFSRRGRFRLTKRDYRGDKFPLDANCNCYACRNFTRAYIRHLIDSDAILGSSLVTMHNITFYQDLMRTLRRAVRNEVFQTFRFAFLDEYLDEGRAEQLGLIRLNDAYDLENLPWDTTHSTIPTTDVESNLEQMEPVDNLNSPEKRIEQLKNL